MENFIKKLKKRLIIFRIAYIMMFIIGIGSVVLAEMGVLVSAVRENDAPLMPMCLGIAFVMIACAVKTKKALKDENKMNEIYVTETDERSTLISKSVSHATSLIFTCLLLIGTAVFAFINEIVYHTLFIMIGAWLVISGACNLYYSKKY